MPPLDWDRVMGLKAVDVDEEAADDLFDMFVKVLYLLTSFLTVF